jgi:ATP-dependent exoDNAse (exonuclease V) beta subunit
MGLCNQIKQDLDDFKRDFMMFEFSDMISEFVKKDKCPSLDVVFLDEAQDLSPLQWDMFFYIESDVNVHTLQGMMIRLSMLFKVLILLSSLI